MNTLTARSYFQTRLSYLENINPLLSLSFFLALCAWKKKKNLKTLIFRTGETPKAGTMVQSPVTAQKERLGGRRRQREWREFKRGGGDRGRRQWWGLPGGEKKEKAEPQQREEQLWFFYLVFRRPSAKRWPLQTLWPAQPSWAGGLNNLCPYVRFGSSEIINTDY